MKAEELTPLTQHQIALVARGHLFVARVTAATPFKIVVNGREEFDSKFNGREYSVDPIIGVKVLRYMGEGVAFLDPSDAEVVVCSTAMAKTIQFQAAVTALTLLAGQFFGLALFLFLVVTVITPVLDRLF